MSFRFPEFPEPQPLDGQRAWTAAFESYDQRKDDLYYIVDLHDAGERTTRFISRVWPGLADDQWGAPVFTESLRAEIAKVAATGATNTDYRGPMAGIG